MKNKIKTLIKTIVLSGILMILVDACKTTSYVTRYQPVTVGDIVQMSKDNVPSSKIIQKIRQSHTVYKLSADQLARLERQGVSADVVNYMEETHLEAVRENQLLDDNRYWWPGWDGYYYGGPAFGWPYSYWNWNWGNGVHFEHEHHMARGGHHR